MSIPALLAMCEPTLESAYHSTEDGGGVRDMVLKLLIRGPCSYEPLAISVQEDWGGCGGGAA